MAQNTKEQPLLNGAAEKEPLLSGATFVVVYILGSIVSSVFIVLCNKEVFERGFTFPLTLSCFGYVFTYLFYVVLEQSGAITRGGDLPRIENIKVALASIASISFMNLCLLTNTVAIYQICKFAVIPCTLLIQKCCYGQDTNWRVLLSLTIVLGGVGGSTGVGLSAGTLTATGVVFACLAVASTSVYRIWQGTKQKEFKIGPVDFQATMAGWQAGLGVVVAVAVEFMPVESTTTVRDWLAEEAKSGFGTKFLGTCGWLMGVSFFALTVNFTSFGLIGRTGPVAYAVVGHAKTVLTIIMGIVLFPGEETPETIRADIIGCAVAMFGVIAFGHFEYCTQNNQPDWVEQRFPQLCRKQTSVLPTK